MKTWLGIAVILIGAVILWRWMWLNSPMREIERSKAAVAAAKSWHSVAVRHIPGLPTDTYEKDTLCPGFQHTIASSTSADGIPIVREWINNSGLAYVFVDGHWTTSGGPQAPTNADAAGATVMDCTTGVVGADQTSLPYDAILDGSVQRGDERQVEGDSCREYEVSVSTPHDPEEKNFTFSICINEADHLPRQTRRKPPGYSQECVSTFTKWNVMKEPQLPAEIPN